jgi:hypothetical protein
VEKSDPTPNSELSGNEPDNFNLTSTRAQELLERMKQQREDAVQERRDGRPLGKLTQSLVEKLRSCNQVQLLRAKKLCDRYIEDHRKPPPLNQCGKSYTVHVLESVAVKNQRFQLEFRRTTRRAKRVYVNGPYVVVYWRDGSIIQSKYIKKDKNLRQTLPRKVWKAIRYRLDTPETEALRQKLIAQVERAS